MIKPFHLSELHARILVHIWTKTNTWEIRDDSIYHICGIDINTKKHSFLRDGKLLHLTQKEFLIVEKLLENKNRVVSRWEIIEYLWGEESLFSGGDNKLDVYISNIRSKLSKWLIVTVKWVWYRIGDCN
jgi:DNA-binding response OmpR family regulator